MSKIEQIAPPCALKHFVKVFKTFSCRVSDVFFVSPDHRYYSYSLLAYFPNGSYGKVISIYDREPRNLLHHSEVVKACAVSRMFFYQC